MPFYLFGIVVVQTLGRLISDISDSECPPTIPKLPKLSGNLGRQLKNFYIGYDLFAKVL